MQKKPYKGKIPPQNLKIVDKKEYLKGLGEHSCSTIRGKGKKYTAICSMESCNYTSRIWITAPIGEFNKFSNSSFTCPFHNIELIMLGDVSLLPKIGNRRRKFLQRVRSESYRK